MAEKAAKQEKAVRKIGKAVRKAVEKGVSWSARLEMCQWIRETLDKESVWDEERSTSLSR